MLTARVRWQIGVFVLVALVGVSYVGARYAGLDRWFGFTGYVVRVQLADSGGIFTNAEVTYRGVPIGRVGPLRLSARGVEVDLVLDDDGPRVPVDSEAVVANRSAVGEQFVDLRPRREGGPYLAQGSVIPQASTRIPKPVESVLAAVDGLVASVPTQSLRTVVDELGTAFTGAGRDLQQILDSAGSFTEAAISHLPQTKALFVDGRTVLDTQAEQSQAFQDLSRNAKLLAQAFRESDGDLRRVIAAVPPVSEQVSAVLRESGPNLGVVIANLLTTSNVFVTRNAGLEQLLFTAPAAVAAGTSIVRSDGAHFGMAVTFFNPLPCSQGYQGTEYRNGLVTTPGKALNTAAACTLPKGSATGVRGSQNAPKGGKVSAATSNWQPAKLDSLDPGTVSLRGLLGLPGGS
ncbi:phospholipid/cholesterol/gamma-HCH transport system substrate-binding protein [Crossiella equi]|uniref:Phospholipid/cholesterol/gamma-HCH transport system substrate-binding protein n=1 Tax=Crossiella equi TaxID=130796 RepID=A0ABS5AMJ9_9PSEU|nr:MlaD family protein [Crossiella equi]MBP2477794.1 phospholipid/cholesterol/gamma-HCH transport system substrate-binding protein [Crossiella equi]